MAKPTNTALIHTSKRLAALLIRFKLARLSDMHKPRGKRRSKLPLFDSVGEGGPETNLHNTG